ncbi:MULTISPECIES: sugar phosphate nucleotidyltransferase [Atopobiaceae]|nr:MULTISPECIES: sugar phosphate nucleotidyltransferase [Atopobiaceae]
MNRFSSDYSAVGTWRSLLAGSVEPWELEELNNPTSLADAFAKSMSFGTGGIRGLMGIGPNRMNVLTVARATQGLADYLKSRQASSDLCVAIGYDTRIHSVDFARIAASVLAANGIIARMFDEPQPTPVLGYAIRQFGCDAGIVITASHNSKEYNGYKVYDSDGNQITDTVARAVQSCIERVDSLDGAQTMPYGEALSQGLVLTISDDIVDDFIDAVLDERIGIDAGGLKVVYSPLNGTGLVPAKKMLDCLGVDYELVPGQSEHDGYFPTCPKPNPENPEAMRKGMELAASLNADIFVATDPDSDRLGVAVVHDGQTRLLTGNEFGLLVLDRLARSGKLSAEAGRPVAVTTIVSTPLVDRLAEQEGLELRRTLTGFKYVGEQIGLLEKNGEKRRFCFGMEESCGYLRGTYVRDKDGICGLMLACEIAAACKSEGMNLIDALDDLYGRRGYMKDRQISLEFKGISGREAISSIMSALRIRGVCQVVDYELEKSIDYSLCVPMPCVGASSRQTLPSSDVLEYRFKNGCKIIFRPSGTESKIKAYLFASGKNNDEADERINTLSESVTAFLGHWNKAGENHMPSIHVVLLSGGSGTRLWPLSNSARSKQFLKVLRDELGNAVSMVQRVFSQIRKVPGNVDITIATSASQAESLEMQVPGRYALVTEPERRDTAPAIMLACEHLALEQGASDDDTVIVMPIDTYADQGYYDCIPKIADTVAQNDKGLVLLGVKPTYPSEKYGYILPSERSGEVMSVKTFKEKPNESTAREYIDEGGLWNCGVFAFKLGYLRAITETYFSSDHYGDYVTNYRQFPKNSFDYEVVEKEKSISVVTYDGTWKDLGTWNTLSEEMSEATSGPVFMDYGTTNNVHAINETGLPMVVAGVSNAVVVATPDGILVSGKEESAHIKGLVSEAAISCPMTEKRSWGSYRVLDYGRSAGARVTEFIVREGHCISLPVGNSFSGSMTVVSGSGVLSSSSETVNYQPGDCRKIGPSNFVELSATTDSILVCVC